MTERKARFMFNSPDQFKKQLDEALWPLLNWVTGEHRLEDWLAWSDLERRDRIQSWLAQSSSPLKKATTSYEAAAQN